MIIADGDPWIFSRAANPAPGMSLWQQAPYNLEKMTATSGYNPLQMFTSCAISQIAVNDASIHTLYRPAQPGGGDIVLVMIHGYPQTHVMWRSVHRPELRFKV
jgi:hypothetical protein